MYYGVCVCVCVRVRVQVLLAVGGTDGLIAIYSKKLKQT